MHRSCDGYGDGRAIRQRRNILWLIFRQLDPPLPVHVLDQGAGYACAVIAYGQEHALIGVTAINDTGAIWCVPHPVVRLQANWTMGRVRPRAVSNAIGGGCAPLVSEPVDKPN